MSIVALLGLGAMGQRMAVNFLESGFDLRVWNRTPERCVPLAERGAQSCASPREAVQHADIVIAMLTDDEASRSVWLDEKSGALAELRHDAIAIECSTLSLAWCRELATAIQTRGLRFLDAPVVGSRPQAESGQLIHLVGGKNESVQQAGAVLAANAAAIYHVGDTCSGMTMKLAVNALLGIQVAALGELLGFLDSCGIKKPFAAELLGKLPVTSPAAKAAAAAVASENYAPLFPVALVHKDLTYAVASAQGHDAALPTTAFVRDLFAEAMRCGYGGENMNAIAKTFETHPD